MHVRPNRVTNRARGVGPLPYGAEVTRLPAETYLDHIRTESARFREVLAGCDPAARVPSCPDWSAADLLWHLATVQRWWAEVVTARPSRPALAVRRVGGPTRVERPADPDPGACP